MRLCGLQKLLVLNVPYILVGPSGNIGDKLAKTPIWISLRQFLDGIDQLGALVCIHGKTSFTFGVRVTLSCGISWIISAVTISPDRSFAALVARVTPSLIRRNPPIPRITCNGGIPSSELPYCAICRASFAGSAPWDRLGGK
jgi:hypothetical protein